MLASILNDGELVNKSHIYFKKSATTVQTLLIMYDIIKNIFKLES